MILDMAYNLKPFYNTPITAGYVSRRGKCCVTRFIGLSGYGISHGKYVILLLNGSIR